MEVAFITTIKNCYNNESVQFSSEMAFEFWDIQKLQLQNNGIFFLFYVLLWWVQTFIQ